MSRRVFCILNERNQDENRQERTGDGPGSADGVEQADAASERFDLVSVETAQNWKSHAHQGGGQQDSDEGKAGDLERTRRAEGKYLRARHEGCEDGNAEEHFDDSKGMREGLDAAGQKAVTKGAKADPKQVNTQDGGKHVGGALKDGESEIAKPDDFANQAGQAVDEGDRQQPFCGHDQFRRGAFGWFEGGLIWDGIGIGDGDGDKANQDADGDGAEVGKAQAESFKHPESGHETTKRGAEGVPTVEGTDAGAGVALGVRHRADEQGERDAHQETRHDEDDKREHKAGQGGGEQRTRGQRSQCGRQRLEPVEHHWHRESPSGDGELDQAEDQHAAAETIGELAANQAAETEAGHEGAEDDADGVRAVAEDGDEAAAPEDLEDHGGGAGKEEAGIDGRVLDWPAALTGELSCRSIFHGWHCAFQAPPRTKCCAGEGELDLSLTKHDRTLSNGGLIVHSHRPRRRCLR